MTLSTRRKADRAKMANILANALREAGAAVTIGPEDSESAFYRRCTRVWISVEHDNDRAEVMVNFDGSSSQPDVHVCTWNTARGSCFSWCMGNINPHHFGKVNVVCYGFEDLVQSLRSDVVKLASGAGFSAENLAILEKQNAERGWPSPRIPAHARPAHIGMGLI
jgi:hypothetical protein